MVFDIEVAGRARRVTVEPDPSRGGLFRVDVDDARYIVDMHPLDASTMSLIVLGPEATSHVVGVLEEGSGGLVVHAAGAAVHVSVNGRRWGGGTLVGEAAPGERRLVAPMPGRVVRVMVAPGDQVTAGQPLVVIEAMKMANELTSPKPGRVRDVAVAPGMSVEAGRLLVVVE